MPARFLTRSSRLVCALLLFGLSLFVPRTSRAADLGPRLEAIAAVAEGRYEDALGLLDGVVGQPDLALLTARCLAALGRYDEALTHLPEPSERFPALVREDIETSRIEWSAEAGRCEEVRSLSEKTGKTGTRIARFLARCAFTSGDYARVRELLSGAKDVAGRSMYIRALFALEERDAALPLARAFYVNDAAHADAEAIFALLRAADPKVTLTFEEQLTRSEALIGARRLDEALRGLDGLPVPKDRALRARREHLRGQAFFRARNRYPEAAKAFAAAAALAGATEAYDAFHAIRATSRAGKDKSAVKRYRAFAKKYPKSSYAPNALYLAAWLSARSGLKGAREELASFANSQIAKKNPALLRDAEWDLGWLAYTQRDAAGAAVWLARYERDANSDLERARASYWLGQNALSGKKKETAATHFLSAIRHETLGYYAQLAVRRLRDLGHEIPSPFEPGSTLPSAPEVEVPEAAAFYAGLGLHEDAARAVERALPEKAERAEQVALLVRAGDAAKAYSAASPYLGATLKAGPDEAGWLWAALFPRPYSRVVEAETTRHGIPDALFYGHMQVESRYRAEVVSGADAIGLMQLLPSTAARVASRLGLPATRRALKQPHVNIALGAAFLGQLLKQYEGQEPLAIAAYNAGGSRVNEWTRRLGRVELDRWVEEIPILQTRNYVRRVIAGWARYRVLAVRTDPWAVPIPTHVGPADKGAP